MFPSSGLFSGISCPVSKRGVCERPHCPYKHATDVRDSLGASYKSPIIDKDRAGLQNGFPFFETTNVCLQELERINKEIKTVTHEVEQEQRRLSHYQTVKADCRSTASDFQFSESEIAGKHVGSNAQSSCLDLTKTSSRAKKYVVDNSKPRTDLEYDPLSNFSADLRSYSSSGKEQKVKNGQCLKKEREAVSCDQNKPAALAQLSQTSPPEPLDESNEDGILVIDIPPSPDEKRGGTPKLDDCVPGKSGIKKECKRSKAVLQYSPTLSKNKGSENKPVDRGVIDLTDCLDDAGSECQITCQTAETEVENNIEPESLPAPSDQHQCWNSLVGVEEEKPQLELSQCEVSGSDEKMNPLEPHQFPSGNSLFNETQAANSGLSCRQNTKDAQSIDLLAHKIPGQIQERAVSPTPSASHKEQEDPTSGTKQSKICLASSADSHLIKEYQTSTSDIAEQLLNKGCDEKVIVISSSEEEFHYSDVEFSDSDPMEECYRIFMEANNEDNGNEKQPTVSVETMDVQRPELNITPPVLLGKRRVAHEVKHAEPAAKSRPQPQVLVPLRGTEASGFGTQSTISKSQQVQQRASMLTASVKRGQDFVSSANQRKPETQTTACPPIQISSSMQPTPVHHAYMNYLSLGTAVIEVGNNLHLILPEGTFPLPVTSSSSPVTSVLTPVSQGHTSNLPVKPTCTAAVTHVQKYRTIAPVLIPAPTRKPLFTSALAHSSSASSIASQPAVKSYGQPLPTKRKLKQQSEAAKVPHDVRQRYVNMFTEEFLKTSASVNDAFEKAVTEERGVYNRSANKLKYTSIAVNLLKRLKNQSAASSKDEENINNQRLKGNIPIDLKKLKGNDDVALYECLKDYILAEERLIESNYPVQHPEKPGSAALFSDNKKSSTDSLKRICCRCGATYSVSQIGKHIRKEECNYHYGKGVTKRVPGGVETRYSCCEGVIGAPGCQVFKLHVHDTRSLDGFVSTIPRHLSDKSCPGVYSLNCEMCYTVHGLELSRVTVVNSRLQVVYDTFVRPDSEVIDYNTRFSGISEEDVKGNNTSIQEVQETLLSFIYADTILIGHSLETDLCALKLLHGMVVDTSVVFPHRLGHPHKLTLNNLTAEYLRRIIQESVCGHDTAEDATACMELMLWKLKEDGKLKK